MRNTFSESIILFIIICSMLILVLISFITYIVFKYQQNQNIYYKEIEEIKVNHEYEKLQSQVEIQEQTFENISREIHDNIGQKLTLAKLYLNTLELAEKENAAIRLSDSVNMISEALNDLSDISRSMSSEIILSNGLIRALELEVAQINRSGPYKITLSVTGDPFFMEAPEELIIFRIVQEALSNIMKHSFATGISLSVNYSYSLVELNIIDNGKGFEPGEISRTGTGLANMKRRASLLKGTCTVDSRPGSGTRICIQIPINERI